MGKEIMIRDLTFSYGGNGNQLEHISLDIAAGEVIVKELISNIATEHGGYSIFTGVGNIQLWI